MSSGRRKDSRSDTDTLEAQPVDKFNVAAIIGSRPVVSLVRRLLLGLKVASENLKVLIEQEVIKRETMEGEKAKEAVTRIKKAGAKLEQNEKRY